MGSLGSLSPRWGREQSLAPSITPPKGRSTLVEYRALGIGQVCVLIPAAQPASLVVSGK